MESFLISFLIIFFCLIFIALLSSSESAFISVSRLRLRHLIEKGNSKAKTVKKIRDEHDRLFSAVIFSGNLFTILATSVGTALALKIFAEVLGNEIAILIATIVMTYLTVVFGELAPKTFAVSHAEKVSLALAKPLDIFIKLISPLVTVFSKSSNFIIHLFGGEVKPQPQLLTEEELRKFVSDSHELGLTVSLAGSLDRGDMAKVFSLGADIVGVRRAVCRGKDRLRGAVHREAVGELVDEIRRLQDS